MQNSCMQKKCCQIQHEQKPDITHPINVQYTNYRGETAVHSIVPIKLFWGKNEYHTQEQWLLEVWDIEKDALRIYALKDIKQWFVSK